MKKILSLSLVAVALGLSGCIDLGEDDKDSGSSAINSVSYTGKTTPANFATETELKDAYEEYMAATGYVGSEFDLGVAKIDPGNYSGTVTKMMSDFSGGKKYTPKAAEKIDETSSGSCGGTAKIVGSFDDVSGAIDVTLIADNFCDNYRTDDPNSPRRYTNGSFNLKGNQESGLTLTYTAFSVKDLAENQDFEVGGTLQWTAGSYPWDYKTTINLNLTDNINSNQIKLQNYVVLEQDYGNYYSESGRVYHSEHGYVDITTLEDLEYSYSYDYPVGGKLRIKAAKTFIIDYLGATYTIGEDANGDDEADSPTSFSNTY